jgi:methionine aminopeptidase
MVIPGAKVVDLANFGDNLINTEVKAKYSKSKRLEKGIAFPTCVSIGNCVGHYSPLSSDATQIQDGDLVKM